MNQRQRNDLDNHITGHYGEDQFREYPEPFDAHDLEHIPPLNVLKAAWDKPLPHEDPFMDEESRLLSVAQKVRDYVLAMEGKP